MLIRSIVGLMGIDQGEVWINGERIGQDHLSPGWTDYRKRIEYATYDVTGQLQAGRNTLGSWLGDGWACGHLMGSPEGFYERKPSLLGTLRVEFPDGHIEWVSTDTDWRCRRSPITSAGLYEGEDHDARHRGKQEPGDKFKTYRRFDNSWLNLESFSFCTHEFRETLSLRNFEMNVV